MTVAPAPRLALRADDLAALSAAAAAAYPKEFCALLIGVDQVEGTAQPPIPTLRVTRVVFADNLHPHPERGFELDPAVLVRELRHLREAERNGFGDGERLLGHAHSHPDAEARPSDRDLAQAYEANQVWLILPVRAGSPGAPKAYQRLSDAKGFRPLAIVSLDEEMPVRAEMRPDQETP